MRPTKQQTIENQKAIAMRYAYGMNINAETAPDGSPLKAPDAPKHPPCRLTRSIGKRCKRPR